MINNRNSRFSFALRSLLLVICLVCIGIAIYQFTDYWKGDTLYKQIEECVVPQIAEQNEPFTADNGEDEMTPTIFDFESLSAINKDTVAFILFPDEQAGYPVVRGEDNTYYLTHMFNNETGSSGCLFLDCQNMPDFSDNNNIIYGHHMKNGSMLAIIEKYKDQSYYDEHPFLYLMTPDGNYQVIIFSAYVTNVSAASWQLGFKSDTAYTDWVNDMKKKSVIDCTYDDLSGPDANDFPKTLTLSTCDYSFDRAKFIVHGYLIDLHKS